MGGNRVDSSPSRVARPTVSPRQKKLETVLKELRELSPTSRGKALSALRKSGQKELADALGALIPAERSAEPARPRGSRPAERPQPRETPAGKR